MLRRCSSIVGLSLVFSVAALTGVFVGPTWDQIDAAKAMRVMAGPTTNDSPEAKAVAALRAVIPVGASSSLPAGSPLEASPSNLVSSVTSKLSALTGAQTSAVRIKNAAAAAATGDLVITVSVEDVDPEVVSYVLNTLWPQQVGSGSLDQELLNTVKDNQYEYGDGGLQPADLPGTTITTSPDTTQVSSTNITVDMPGADATNPSIQNWQSSVVATLLANVVYWLTEIPCLAAFGPVVGATAGTFSAVALGVCGAISNGISTLSWFLISKAFSCGVNSTCFNRTYLLQTFASTAVAALFGGFGYAFSMAIGPLRKLSIWLAGKLRSAVATAVNWVKPYFPSVDFSTWPGAVSDFFVSIGKGIARAWRVAVTVARGGSASDPPIPLVPIPGQGGIRAMALGDSITAGFQSSDQAGYRCALQSYLDAGGNTYQFVGSLSAGTCTDEPFDNGGSFQPQNEGRSGWTISQIQSIERCTITGYNPNVVFLDIGTNDVNRGGDPNTAATADENLINSIFTDDPGVAIVVGGLIPTGTYASNMQTFNSSVSNWISQHPSGANGGHVVWAEMTAVRGFDLADGLHPNDTGYDKMAFPWIEGLKVAGDNGWIHAASNTTGTGCAWSPTWNPVGLIASGPGYSAIPGPGGLSLPNASTIALADMNGDGRNDIIEIDGGSAGSLRVWLNGGQDSSGVVNWLSKGQVASYLNIPSGSYPYLADVNGDGKADFLLVASDSSVTAVLNLGPESSGGWQWSSVGKIASGTGVLAGQVRFADVNGDKKADYLVLSGSNGQVTAWLSGGQGCGNWCWYPQGVIASGGGCASPTFPDLNGDGLADYACVNSNSSVTAYLNPGLQNLSNGGGWISEGTIASGVGGSGSSIQFADVNGDRRDDYLVVNYYTGGLNEYENAGSGCGNWCWYPKGTITQGSGASYQIQFGNVNDTSDTTARKRVDYLVVRDDAMVSAWANYGQNASANYGWDWRPVPTTLNLGVGDPGGQIVWADINGDGLADYLDVDTNTGAVKAWLNDATFLGEHSAGTIATGVGAPGSHIRFADINGDGKADYINVNSDSSIQVWLNGGPGCGGWCWYPQGTIATGVGAPGSQIQFADLNGDGLADYLNVKPDGSIDAWLNGGANSSANGGWVWYPKGTIATGVGTPGSWIHLADITGDGKADYLSVDPTTGATKAWLNIG
jgi:lysophospholipase L1-like esterase